MSNHGFKLEDAIRKLDGIATVMKRGTMADLDGDDVEVFGMLVSDIVDDLNEIAAAIPKSLKAVNG